MADFKEDLFKSSDRDAVCLNLERGKVVIKVSKEVLEQRCVLSWYLDGHFALDLCQLGDVRAKSFVQVGHDKMVGHRVILDHSHHVANTEAVLEEHGGAKTGHLAAGHDTDSVAEDVSLVHVMSRQEDDPVLLVGSQHVPQLAPSLDVQT